MADVLHTPDRLRALASRVYRIGASFPDLREVGDYLAAAALAADEQGDILQQHEAAKAELARLHQAVAEADAARIERDNAKAELAALHAKHITLQRMAVAVSRDRDAMRAELDGQRLWYRLALEWIEELRPLVPADKQTLIDPMRAASVAKDHRRLIRGLVVMLRRMRDWASLHAQTANDPHARADVGDADALLESDECRPFSLKTRS
jgi:hypothetical protein